MQEHLTAEEKNNLLITRATRLAVFADKLGERGRYLIEAEAYLVLEVFAPRPRAILRYTWRALKLWRRSLWFSMRFGAMVWYNRRVKGLDHGKAIDLACASIEERAIPSQKGGA